MSTATATGPKGMPIFGNYFEFDRDPMEFLMRCAREYGDVVRLMNSRI